MTRTPIIRNMRPVVAIALLSMVSFVGSAQAALQLYEPFDYGPQDNATKFLKGDNDHNGGTGWANEWKANSGNPESTGGVRLDLAEVTQPYPAGTNLTSTGGRIENDFGGGSSDRAMTTAINMNTPGDLYFSALVNWSTGAAFRAEFVRSSDGVVRWTPFDIDASGNVKTGVVGLGSGSVALSSGVDYLFVGKIDRVAGGGADTASLSIFEVSSPGAFLTAPVTWDVTGAGASGVVMDLFRLTMDNGTTSIVDEIRLGTTYADVVGIVPAPAALPAGLLCLASIAARRRRRR